VPLEAFLSAELTVGFDSRFEFLEFLVFSGVGHFGDRKGEIGLKLYSEVTLVEIKGMKFLIMVLIGDTLSKMILRYSPTFRIEIRANPFFEGQASFS